MKILHYFLGFPPYRTGGLTKFAFDLMQSQAKTGHEVSALWPGRMPLVFKKMWIRQGNAVGGVANYELINPMPVPLDEGIQDIATYTASRDADVFIRFLKEIRPEAIHIHTLMGLPREFLEVARTLGIRTVFTSHDYFGLCPKVIFYRHGEVCDDDHHCADCVECNRQALSLKKIALMQSPLYRKLKDSLVFKKLRSIHRLKFAQEQASPNANSVQGDLKRLAAAYSRLRSYYVQMLSLMDVFHFNSSETESIYRKYLQPKSSKVISITHKDIADNRILALKKEKNENLRLTYLGPAKSFKGFFVMKKALDELWQSGIRNFELHLFCPVENSASYMHVENRRFQYSELKQIFANTDVLLVPSVWHETFGFTVLEALSYGVPVVVSDHVGAKDLVGNNGIVVKAGSVDELKSAILMVKSNLEKLTANVQTDCRIKDWNSFLLEIETLYRR